MPAGSILVADDDTAIRTVLNQALSRAGYEVRLTGNAATLWRWVSQGEGDLVITDVVMPNMDGPALIREVREIHPDMKVIFISGYTEDAFRQRLDSDSEIHFLPKPFSFKQLAGKVKEVISGETVL